MQNAAEFDGVGAGRQLLARYDGYSRQRNHRQRNSDDEAESTHRDPAPPPHSAPDNTLVDETEDHEEREYYTAVIDGVRSLRYSIVVPPDGPPASLDLAPQGNSKNANEPHVQPTQHDSRWGENTRITGMETPANPHATQSSSVDPYPWGDILG